MYGNFSFSAALFHCYFNPFMLLVGMHKEEGEAMLILMEFRSPGFWLPKFCFPPVLFLRRGMRMFGNAALAVFKVILFQ